MVRGLGLEDCNKTYNIDKSIYPINGDRRISRHKFIDILKSDKLYSKLGLSGCVRHLLIPAGPDNWNSPVPSQSIYVNHLFMPTGPDNWFSAVLDN